MTGDRVFKFSDTKINLVEHVKPSKSWTSREILILFIMEVHKGLTKFSRIFNDFY